jgi:sugar O-acyltransferase (sialic acid O-acetyltransferase NeuD family)
MRSVWVFGSGGHAKTVIDTLRAMGDWDITGLLDDDRGRWGMEIMGIPVRGNISEESIARFGIERAVVAIGSNTARARTANRFAHLVSWVNAVHPRAYLASGVHLGAGSVVFAGTVVQPDTTIGDHVILNTMCGVSHDSVIGDFAHVGPGVHLAGNAKIGEGAFLGVGSCVLPGRAVGAWATIGAGGVVVTDVPERVIAKGVPARVENTRLLGDAFTP